MVSQEMLQLGTARSVIRELFEYGRQRALVVGEENVFDFSIGNPNVPPPEVVNEKAIALLQQGGMTAHSYTSAQGDPKARALFAASLSKRTGMPYGEENFYVTAGAAAALSCCIRGLHQEGDEWMILAPYFPEYHVFVQAHGGIVVEIPPLLPSFGLHLQEIEARLTEKTKGVIVNSPNNPSGAVYTKAELSQLAELLQRKSEAYGHPIYLISDEPYRELVYEGEGVPWIPSLYPNTLVCYSFSKSLSLPGQRIGYVLVGQEVAQWEQVYGAVAGAGRSLGYVNAPSLFQQVVAECCELTSDISIYQKNRDLLIRHLTQYGYETGQPEGAFYLFMKTLEEDDVAFCEKAKEFDLLLVSGRGFGVSGYARLSYCVSTDKVERSLDRFKQLAEWYRNKL